MVAISVCSFRSGEDVLPGSLAAGTGGAAEADSAGADEFLEAVRADQFLERVDVFGCADQLEDDRVGAEVGDTRVEDFAERDELGPGARRRGHLQQDEFALDRLAGAELGDAEHVHELVHLLLDLLERLRLAVDAQCDARDVVALGRADREAVDVEAAACEQARDPHQDTWLVLDENGERVLHAVTASTVSTNSTTSSAAAPLGIIGKQCSHGSTRASTTAVRPEASASASALSSSSSLSTVNPSAPYARASWA